MSLGTREQLLYFGFQLRLDLLRMPVGQRTVARGVGVNLGAIKRDGAQFKQLHLPWNHQLLHEQRAQFFQKALAKGAQRAMIGLLVRGKRSRK